MNEADSVLEIDLEHDRRVNYAMQQNDVPVVKRLRIRNPSAQAVEDVRLRIWIEGGLSRIEEIRIVRIPAGGTYDLAPVPLPLDPGMLVRQTEREASRIHVEADAAGTVLARTAQPLEILAYNEWGGLASLPEILAAFVLPNHPGIGSVLARARTRLESATGNPSFDAYASRSSTRVRAIVEAIHLAIRDADLAYIHPPASFEETGQKIRTPEQILGDRLGTCLDLALLAAGCLEEAGLHPLLVLVRGHAFPAVWLSDESFPEATVDDPARIRKRVRLDEILAFDATTVTTRPPATLAEAEKAAWRHLEDPEAFLCALDLRAARRRGIRPLPLRASADDFRVVPEERTTPGPPPVGATVEGGAANPLRPEAAPPSPEPAPKEAPQTRLDRWRRKLLDLSLRNRLIHYRPTKRSIPLLCPDLPALEDALAEGRSFSVHPQPDLPIERAADAGGGVPPGAPGEIVERFLREELAGQRLRAALPREEMERRLLEIYRTARVGWEESGANTLFLAIGFLEWYETPTSPDARRAPILLLPLEIERRTFREGFRIRLSDEDPRINATLLEKLRTEFPIDTTGLDAMPEDASGVDVEEVLRRFRRAVRDLDRWDVHDDVHLGIFSFTKFLMWLDLQERSARLLESDVVRHLVELPDAPFDADGAFPDPDRLDEEHPPEGIFCPLDADSSQLAAVLAGEAGRTFVLEGPPGTGKSQTIANLVAQCLANGKRVLFVSEKMAALDVVFRRLCQVGLGPFCLELHSNRSRKKDVLEQLGAAFEAVAERTPGAWEREAKKLAALRRELDRYVDAIHRERKIGESVFEATSELVGLRDVPGFALDAVTVADLDETRLDRLRETVDRLATAAREAGDLHDPPLRGIRLEAWTPDLAGEVAIGCRTALDAARSLEEAIGPCARRLGLAGFERGAPGPGPSADAVESLGRIVDLLLATPGPTRELLECPGWSELRTRLAEWIARGRARDRLRVRLLETWREEFLGLDAGRLAERLRRALGSFPPFSWLGAMGVRRTLKSCLRVRKLPSGRALLEDLEAAVDLAREEAALRDPESEAARLFGPHWDGGVGDGDSLERVLAWAGEIRTALLRAPAPDDRSREGVRRRVVELATDRRDDLAVEAPAGGELRALGDARARFGETLDTLAERLQLDRPAAFGDASEPDHLDRVRARLEAFAAHLGDLRPWCHFARVRREAQEVGLGPLVRALEGEASADGPLPPEDLTPAFERSFREPWLRATLDSDEELRDFQGAEHERMIRRFRELDRDALELAGRELRARLADRVPQVQGRVAAGSEVGILQHQLRLRRRHLPVRSLFRKIEKLLARIKPCFLMSPLSVAQYLDASFPPFDLVVFDEASQIPVWDAVGAMARGKNIVVVGDSKQLPPTSFFQKMEGDEELSEDEFEELESVLDTCVAARLPRLYLGWHYRSRHEALIAFSNHHYYGDRLLTFPSARDRSDRLGVSLRLVEGAVYDRGGKRTNEAEARAVVRAIVERLGGPGDPATKPSLGVVTFSLPQQALIEDLLEEERARSADLDLLFTEAVAEPVFVKNLENVQGDERDVILFSVCYGPDASGRVSMGFGPLNRDGGERRLNVAITRARERVLVFSSMRADRIDLARTQSVGVRDLQAFLDYAEHGPRAIGGEASAGEARAGSPFERSMRVRLVERGWRVEAQVGCSGYRIDLAVRDPDDPGAFLLGIEGDGRNYARARTARDRDRLREAVLRRLGWRLHRVWSVDWWFDEARSLAKIEDALGEALEARAATPATAESDAPPSAAGGAPPAPATLDDDPPHPPIEDPTPGSGVPYRTYASDAPPGDPEEFHRLGATRRIRDALVTIVRAEGPIHRNLAARRLAALWGIGRVTSRVVDRMIAAFESLPASRRPILRGEFLWDARQDPEAYRTFRVPEGGPEAEAPRAAEEIAPEEAANAAAQILEAQISLPEADLVRETARLFGYRRLGRNVEAAMEAGIRHLEGRGGCVRDGDRIASPA